jgi:1,4-dihydroxy-2-naphthoyl-CoA synthase
LAHISDVGFAHRPNDNGTTDSICLKCFMTIASKERKADLAASEAAHECGGFDLAYSLHPVGQKRAR